MPFLKQKFPTFHQFASASLQDIYGTALEAANHLEVNELRSGIFWNDSPAPQKSPSPRLPTFTFEPLPALAQVAPAFGVQAVDLNGDDHLDLALAHNFYSPQRETGRMDGGLGVVLLGDGRRGFQAQWPDVSGLVLNADAKALTVADLNRDGRDDLIIGINDGPTLAWLNQSTTTPARALELRSPSPGNPHAIGTRVTFHGAGTTKRAAEVHLGDGYLSQSSPLRRLRLPTGTTHLDVHWPNGTTTSHRVDGDPNQPLILKPGPQ